MRDYFRRIKQLLSKKDNFGIQLGMTPLQVITYLNKAPVTVFQETTIDGDFLEHWRFEREEPAIASPLYRRYRKVPELVFKNSRLIHIFGITEKFGIVAIPDAESFDFVKKYIYARVDLEKPREKSEENL
jgi:hypothetical protein